MSLSQSLVSKLLGLRVFRTRPHLGRLILRRCPPDSSQEVPRYQWQVGKQARYQFSWEFRHANGRHGQTGRWELTVLAVDEVGKATIGVKRFVTPYQVRGQDRFESAPRVMFDLLKVSSDGTADYQPRVDSDFNPLHMLPRLPENQRQRREGWYANSIDRQSTSHYLWRSQESGWEIEEEERSVFSKVYGLETRRRFRFGGDSPFPREVILENRQGYGMVGSGMGKTELSEVVDLDPTELARDYAAYLNAVTQLNQSVRRATESVLECEVILKDAIASLAEAREGLRGEDFKSQLFQRANLMEQQLEPVKQAAQRRSRLLGQPSAPWSTSDLAGQTRALSVYAGKVVLLDFWYRGSSWCVRSMPVLKKIADRYADDPFVILGMNADGNPEDAEFVVEAMGLSYPILKAGPAVIAYEVRVYPTMLLLDAKGTIREVHLGFVPNLEEELIAEIEPLLEEARTAQSSAKS